MYSFEFITKLSTRFVSLPYGQGIMHKRYTELNEVKGQYVHA